MEPRPNKDENTWQPFQMSFPSLWKLSSYWRYATDSNTINKEAIVAATADAVPGA